MSSIGFSDSVDIACDFKILLAKKDEPWAIPPATIGVPIKKALTLSHPSGINKSDKGRA
jgi:hypothetical protein